MRRVLFGVIITLMLVLVFRSCVEGKIYKKSIEENSELIQEEIKNVSKLVVTEGHFSQVYTYKDSRELFGPLFTADKKALVVVNAEVLLAYDLRQLDFQLDEASKTMSIRNIPELEIKINPDLEFYDIDADYLNPFSATDYNIIKRNVRKSVLDKVMLSNLKANAEERLLSELSKFYLLTNSMGWKLTYRNEIVNEGFSQDLIKN
ncbi:DUF4230 domain-containing protein [Eudoraea chungangensis]|uniref:DUF4230 domain-containing protein n=1 Tax=Eudoraea chungangensis TaxID=1481905 RepID=UPI0023EB1B84|nr:DUF4230 domain-containing protein [Eudoraea chungangensis]